MKQQIAAAITAALILTSISACSRGVPEDRSDSQGSSSEDSSTLTSTETPPVSGSEIGSDDNSADSEPVKKNTYIFGETEIPDIDGYLSESSLKPLEGMAFEVHKYGDYTITLIGEDVRTNKKNFPGTIQMSSLRIEVEKNGVILGAAGYIDQFSCGAFYPTLTLFEDKIGSYISFYDMDAPVIALKYYFHESAPTDVEKILMFATIQNEEVENGFVGVAYDLMGVGLSGQVTDYTQIYPSSAFKIESVAVSREKRLYRTFIFGSEEFKIVDGQTLVDEEAGVKYTFDFSDPMLFERYTAEKID